MKEKEEYDSKSMRQLLTKKTLLHLFNQNIYDSSLAKYFNDNIKSEPIKKLLVDMCFFEGEDESEVSF